MVPFIDSVGEIRMSKDDILGFALVPLAFIICMFHDNLANFVGAILNMLFANFS